VANTVARLRAKVEISPAEPRYILTVHGGGYVFEPPEEPNEVSTAAESPETPEIRVWTDGVPGLGVLWRTSGFSPQVLVDRPDLRAQLVLEMGAPVVAAIRNRWEPLSDLQRRLLLRLLVLPGGATVEDLITGPLQPLLELIRDGWVQADTSGRNILRKGFFDVLPGLFVPHEVLERQRWEEAQRLSQHCERIWLQGARTTEGELWTAQEWLNLDRLSAVVEEKDPRLAGSLLLGLGLARMREGVDVAEAIVRVKRITPLLGTEDLVRWILEVYISHHEWGVAEAAQRLDAAVAAAQRLNRPSLELSARMARFFQGLESDSERHALILGPVEYPNTPEMREGLATLLMMRALRRINVGEVEAGLEEGGKAIALLSAGLPASAGLSVCAMVACMYTRLGMLGGVREWLARFRELNQRSGLRWRDGVVLLEAEVAGGASADAIARLHRLRERMVLNNNHRGVVTVRWQLCLCYLDRGEYDEAARVVGDLLAVQQVPAFTRQQYLMMHTLAAIHTGDRGAALMSIRLLGSSDSPVEKVVQAILRRIVTGELEPNLDSQGPVLGPLMTLYRGLVADTSDALQDALDRTADPAQGIMVVRVFRRWIALEYHLKA